MCTPSRIAPLLLGLSLLGCASTAQRITPADERDFVPIGLFIGSIEEGARIFTPVRLLPFDHPESLGHEFPNALQLYGGEYGALVWLGEQVGMRLVATLGRYPMAPSDDWQYHEFREIPIDILKGVETVHVTHSVIPGLRAVAFIDGVPVCFLVDTRGLTLEERGMDRPTAMGLDLTRSEFLSGLRSLGEGSRLVLVGD